MSWSFNLSEITDYESWKEKVRDHLKKPRIQGIASVFLSRLQGIESVSYDVLEQRSIDSAIGAQLDGIGQIVQEKRGQKSDALYRKFLKSAILANLSHGRAPQIQEVIYLLYYLSFEFTEYYEEFPATLYVTFTKITANLNDYFELLSRTVAGGVSFRLKFNKDGENYTFQCSETYGSTPTIDYDKGAGSNTYSLGGTVCGLYERGK